MEITNKHGIPQIIVDAIKNDGYDFEPTSDAISSSEFTNPHKINILKRRHHDEITEDASDRLWALFGQLFHGVFEKTDNPDRIQEERLEATINGITVSGKFDNFENGIVQDFKTTSVWSVVYKDIFQKWEIQLNIYAYLLRTAGFAVSGLETIVFMKDWQKSKAKNDRDYPQSQLIVVPLILWTIEEQELFLVKKINEYQQCILLEDDKIPVCSPEDRWERPTKWAIMKHGRKSAVKLHESEESANNHLATLDLKHYIEVRKGVCTRCLEYCPVKEFCNHGRELSEV